MFSKYQITILPLQERLSQHSAKAVELTGELAEARKQSIEEVAHYIFPIEVQELDEQDMDISKSGNYVIVLLHIMKGFNCCVACRIINRL